MHEWTASKLKPASVKPCFYALVLITVEQHFDATTALQASR